MAELNFPPRPELGQVDWYDERETYDETVETTLQNHENALEEQATTIDTKVTTPSTGAPSATTYLRGDGSWSTPPDTNTTYSAMPASEVEAGTAVTSRTITAKVLADEIERRTTAKVLANKVIDGVVTEALLPDMPPGLYIVEP